MELSYTHNSVSSSDRHWYVIRVTCNRTISVFNAINNLGWPNIEVYYPCHTSKVYTIDGITITEKSLETQSHPILPGFLFLNSVEHDYRLLLEQHIPGLTPYYDHFHENELGRNMYLTVSDRDMANFRCFCESHDEKHKLINQKDMPKFLNGKKVRIISGPFRGVEGIILRWHSMRRVFLTLGDIAMFGTGFIRSCDFELINE